MTPGEAAAAFARITTACEEVARLGTAHISIHRVDAQVVELAIANGGVRSNFRKTKAMPAFWSVRIKIAGVEVTLFPRVEVAQ